EVYRAGLADEPRAECLEHTVHLNEDAPQPMRVLGVVRAVLLVLLEGDALRDLDGRGPDAYVDAERPQRVHHLAVKGGDGFRLQRDRALAAVARRDLQHVVGEVKIDLEGALSVGDGRGGQPARGDVER